MNSVYTGAPRTAYLQHLTDVHEVLRSGRNGSIFLVKVQRVEIDIRSRLIFIFDWTAAAQWKGWAISGVRVLGGQPQLYIMLSDLTLNFLICKVRLVAVLACNEKVHTNCLAQCSASFLTTGATVFLRSFIQQICIVCCVRRESWCWGCRWERRHLGPEGISSLMKETEE